MKSGNAQTDKRIGRGEALLHPADGQIGRQVDRLWRPWQLIRADRARVLELPASGTKGGTRRFDPGEQPVGAVQAQHANVPRRELLAAQLDAMGVDDRDALRCQRTIRLAQPELAAVQR